MTSLNTADQDSFLTPGSQVIPILGPPLVPGIPRPFSLRSELYAPRRSSLLPLALALNPQPAGSGAGLAVSSNVLHNALLIFTRPQLTKVVPAVN